MGRVSRPLALVAMVASLAIVSDAMAGGFAMVDSGIRRMGMFALVANPDDPTAVFHNPAGMVLLSDTHLYHSQAWFFADTGIRYYDSQGFLHPDHPITPDWNIAALPFLGVVTDFGHQRLRGGLALYTPNAYGAAMPDDQPSRYHGTRAAFVTGRITAAFAYEVDERFAVGVGANTTLAYLTTRQYMNPLVLVNPDIRFDQSRQSALRASDWTVDIEGLDASFSADVAVLLRPLPTLRLGFVFASGSLVELEGDFVLNAPHETVEGRHLTPMPIPLELRAGVSWEPVPDIEVAADVRFWHYQVFQEQRSTLSFGDRYADSPALGLLSQVLVDNQLVVPKNYDNSWNWCVGLKYLLRPSLELMVGYQQDYSPIPDSTIGLENPSRDLFGLAGGVRWRIDDRWKVGIAYIHNWFELMDVQTNVNNPPFNVKGYGSSQALGFDVMWTIE